MSSAGTYRLAPADWLPGDASTRRIDIGCRGERNPEVPSPLGILRVGFQGASPLDRVLATVSPGDDGSLLGPIEVPFLLVLPQPMHVEFVPDGSPRSTIRVVASVCDVQAHHGAIEFANYAASHLVNAVVALPQWVRQVNVLSPAAAQFRDRSSAALGAAFSGPAARPSLAVDLLVTVAGVVVLSY